MPGSGVRLNLISSCCCLYLSGRRVRSAAFGKTFRRGKGCFDRQTHRARERERVTEYGGLGGEVGVYVESERDEHKTEVMLTTF